VTASKLIAKTGHLEVQFGIRVTNLWFYWEKKFVTFGYVVGISFPREN
jgi:hypothetical protein